MRTIFALAALLSIHAQVAHAQSAEEMTVCLDRANGVSTKILECGKVEIAEWDSRLNAAYRKLLHRETGTKRLKLQAEQKAWLTHHLAEAHRLASDPDVGSGAFMISQGFELDDITKRTLQLEKRVRDGS